MPVPKSVTKVSKNGVTFINSVDRAQYTLTELIRAANRDVGKYVRKEAVNEAKTLPGMRRAKRPYNAFQYWARKRETDLQVGIKHNTWYGAEQELGSNGQPKRAILRNAVYKNIGVIREIQAQYLSFIENEIKALSVIDEQDYTGDASNEKI